MKKRYLLTITTLIAMAVLFLAGCKKEDPEPEDPNGSTTGNPAVGGFTWTPNGSGAVVADNAFFITAYDNIVATKNGNLGSVDIILEDLNVGAHAISPSNGITLEYATPSVTYTGKSGTVNITDKTGTSMSGNFTAVLNGGTITSISGQFNNIHEK